MRKGRIVIVGAGPVGCCTAQLLKKIGYNPILIEEHIEVGKPVQCAGIVSSDIISMVKPFITDDAVINTVNGFSINTPWEESFTIKKEGVAIILNREKFDTSLGKGLKIHLGEKLSSIEQQNGIYLVKTTLGKEYEADILIGTDGVDSLVREYLLKKYMNKKSYRNTKLDYYFGLQYQIELSDPNQLLNSNVIQVFFDEDIPFFIWIVPENSQLLRIGVVSEQGKKILDRFIREKNIKGRIRGIVTGKIPVGFIPTSSQGIALVGDAACQIKPLTGGGLSYGLQSAQILVDCIKEGELEQYDERWKKKFGQEIRFGIRARKIYEKLDGNQRAELFQLFKNNSDFIEQVVDFDNHSKLFKEVFQRPKLVLEAGKLLKHYLQELARDFFK